MTKKQITEEVRQKARDLIIIHGFSQRKTAMAFGVSQMTICRWVSKYKLKNNGRKQKRKNRSINPAIEDKKRRAGDLIVIQGFNQKQTAIAVEVSQKTVHLWVRKYKWKNKARNPFIRINAARYLVVNRGYFQKHAALTIGVSRKTMAAWTRKYKWKNARKKVVEKHLSFENFVEYFLIYVSCKNPTIQREVQKLWDEYAIELRYNIGLSK